MLLLFSAVAAGCLWLSLAAAIAWGRLRHGQHAPDTAPLVIGDWHVPPERDRAPAEPPERGDDARSLLEQGLRSPERDVRVAAITTLGRLADRNEWAVDGLIEALVSGIEGPAARIAAELDRLAPRPGTRLVPLLTHPSQVVRFYAIRLLARYPELARRHVPDCARDPSPRVRAAVLETLGACGSATALRAALRALDDPDAAVRAHAIRTASTTGAAGIIPFVAPLLGDGSWWVREAAAMAIGGMEGHAVPARLLEPTR